MSDEACTRWFLYRDCRNTTAHDYGEELANETLQWIPDFLTDAKQLLQKINAQNA